MLSFIKARTLWFGASQHWLGKHSFWVTTRCWKHVSLKSGKKKLARLYSSKDPGHSQSVFWVILVPPLAITVPSCSPFTLSGLVFQLVLLVIVPFLFMILPGNLQLSDLSFNWLLEANNSSVGCLAVVQVALCKYQASCFLFNGVARKHWWSHSQTGWCWRKHHSSISASRILVILTTGSCAQAFCLRFTAFRASPACQPFCHCFLVWLH